MYTIKYVPLHDVGNAVYESNSVILGKWSSKEIRNKYAVFLVHTPAGVYDLCACTVEFKTLGSYLTECNSVLPENCKTSILSLAGFNELSLLQNYTLELIPYINKECAVGKSDTVVYRYPSYLNNVNTSQYVLAINGLLVHTSNKQTSEFTFDNNKILEQIQVVANPVRVGSTCTTENITFDGSNVEINGNMVSITATVNSTGMVPMFVLMGIPIFPGYLPAGIDISTDSISSTLTINLDTVPLPKLAEAIRPLYYFTPHSVSIVDILNDPTTFILYKRGTPIQAYATKCNAPNIIYTRFTIGSARDAVLRPGHREPARCRYRNEVVRKLLELSPEQRELFVPTKNILYYQ